MLVAMGQSSYQAYTLRLSPGGPPGVWRATLYSAQTGERWRFADLEQLHAFLCQAVAAPAWPDQPLAPAAQDEAEVSG
jgi:hypothetical protein